MATLAAACRTSACLVGRRAAGRGFTTAARRLAAHNFSMPALSPTMTEGNIAAWKVGEGEPFSAGDVLLEIETDKATMDVEAQDDGVMVKIMAQDGSKSVQVGTRIAVLAESGDDIASLELPPENQPVSDGAPADDAAAPQRQSEPKSTEAATSSYRAPSGETRKHKYPLTPAVELLVKQHSIGSDDVARITPTGPHGRLLKGDVLAFLGTIDAGSPAAVSSRFEKLARLDLSNVKVAEKRAPPAHTGAAPAPKPPAPRALEIHVPVSLAKVVEVQEKIEATLGVFLPLSTFISRAAEVANDHLPPAAREPSPSQLFDQVLGLDKVKAAKGSHGIYVPQVSAIPPPSMLAPRQSRPGKVDIIDELAGLSKKMSAPSPPASTTGLGPSSGANVFRLVVPKEEEQRAQVFLQRCKLILEKEPGRLVL